MKLLNFTNHIWINVALLHDTIEDTILTHADISKIFDKNIADSVERLTRIKPYGKISSGEMLNLLIQEQRYDIALIKVFDRLHNLQTINAKSTDKALETVKETIESFLLIAKEIFQKVGLRNFFFKLQNNTK